MPLTRRNLIELSAAGATALAVGGRFAPAVAAVTDAIRDQASDYFGEQGFQLQPPLGLITGEAFNGGLRYDESTGDIPSGKGLTIQTSARIEDIAERDRPGVLAAFNIIGLEDPDPDDGTILPAVLRFLIDERGLDPARMLFVSTEEFRPHAERLDSVRAGRVVERPIEETRLAGDGSGYFAPDGHPSALAVPTVGLYYPVPGTVTDGEPVYPPPGYIEIAEVGLVPTTSGVAGAGIGLERLAMAEGASEVDFDETRLNLLRLIEDEAERTGKPLPEGYRLFASL